MDVKEDDSLEEIVARNLYELRVLTDRGNILEITDMFDSDGDTTDDPEECVSFIGQWPDGTWFSEKDSDYTNMRVQ